MRWLDAASARLRLLFAPGASEARMNDEIRFHIDMETERLMGEGLGASEARRRAQVAFGGADRYREELRDGRGTRSLSGLSLDVRLGMRMLRKYPGLTVVATLALTFAVGVGAFGFEAIRQTAGPTLPYETGDRLVSIRLFDVAQRDGRGLNIGDFDDLTGSVAALETLGAYRTVRRNLMAGSDDVVPTNIAEITPSGFAVTGERPVLGRPLLPADAEAGAGQVVVIGEEIWRGRFGADSSIVGRTVTIGDTRATVAGVMPERFGFPYAHQVWVPLRVTPASSAQVELFGVLAPGATLQQADAEMRAQMARLAAADPGSYEHLGVAVLPYTHPYGVESTSRGLVRSVLYSTNLLFVLFVILIAANVAALIFARTATRESEIVVRTALGASRRRIVTQLFLETLLLGMLAVPAGLVLAVVAMEWTMTAMRDTGATLPFWITPSLSAPSILFGCTLAVLGCAIAGAAPGMRVTRRVGTQLRQLSAGAGGPRLGGAVTVAIVLQIAVTVIFVAFATYLVIRGSQIHTLDPSFTADRYLAVQLQMDRTVLSGTEAEQNAALDRFSAMHDELERRLLSENDVAGVTFGSVLPGKFHQRLTTQIESGDSVVQDRIQTARVAPDFFETLGSRITSGRTFNSGEIEQRRPVAVVNESFVRDVLEGRNPVGRRLRFAQRDAGPDSWSEWYDVIGVTADLPLTNDPELPHSGGIYLPLEPSASAVYAAIATVGADAGTLRNRVRDVAFAIDPTMQVRELQTLSEAARAEMPAYQLGIRVLILASGLALLLSLAATHAVMSYSVSRRTREIGIRLALGARPHRVVAAVVGRQMLHAAAGVVLGVALLVLASGGIRSWTAAAVVSLFLLAMLLVVLLSSVVPVRRALAVQPAQALKVD